MISCVVDNECLVGGVGGLNGTSSMNAPIVFTIEGIEGPIALT
jgi:hypothetical protein